MSLSRESVVFVVLANLVLTVVVAVGAVLVLRGDERAEGDDANLRALVSRIDEIERSRSAGPAELSPEELNLRSELQGISERQDEILARIEKLEKSPRAVGDEGDSGAGGEEAAAKAPNPTDALMKIAGRMMADRMKRERDRYIDAIMNPTAETKAEQERMFRGLARRTARSLGLDEQQQAQLEQILVDVDNLRRDRFRDLINSKSSPNDVTADEVDAILKQSWEEEDRKVESTLPREKSDQYKREAEPIRSMMSGMAKSLFNEDGGVK